MTPPFFDVAIVGYGPAGALLANLLGAYGLNVVVLEREADIYPLPRAIHFDGEVMRVFETAGLRAEIEAISRPGLVGMHFNNAAGETLLIRGGTSPMGPHGCASNHYFHQPELEAVLRKGVNRYPSVQVRTSCEVITVNDTEAGATLTVRDMGRPDTEEIKAHHVVGCDGGRSLIRKLIDSPMIDLGLHQPWLVFDVRLKTNVATLPDYTVQHCDPARPMTYCNVTGNRRRWEIMLMPGDDPEQMVQPDHLWRMVAPWLTPEQADIERAVIYTFHSLIAQNWRKGHMLLAGDAAHQTPPFLGQGMCAAVRDVANLAWKLESVIRSRAPKALLDTYETERLPHVRAFIELAVKLGDIIQTTDPEAARTRDAKFKADQPEIFHFPAPRLGPGIWHGDHPLAGQIFPQPRLVNQTLIDTSIGPRFALIATCDLLAQVSGRTRKLWQDHPIVVLDDTHPELQTWLQNHQVQAVLLRPDRYIMGLATDATELENITALVPMAPQNLH